MPNLDEALAHLAELQDVYRKLCDRKEQVGASLEEKKEMINQLTGQLNELIELHGQICVDIEAMARSVASIQAVVQAIQEQEK